MKPYKFTKVGNVYTYHYKFSDMRAFIASKEQPLLFTKWDGKYKTFRGFMDLYSRPTGKLITYKLQHVEAFDGKFDPESVVNPNPKPHPFFNFPVEMSVTSQLKTMDENFNKNILKWEGLQIGDKVKFPFFSFTKRDDQEWVYGTIVDKEEPTQVFVSVNFAVVEKHVGMITKI
jgi:hypothetical protein